MQPTALALAVFLLTFTIYARTSFPSVTGGDAGELLAESCQLGRAHPPGYPLFTLIIHLVTLVANAVAPGVAGAPAQAANLLSCFCGSVAATFTALTVCEWNKSMPFPEAAAGGALAGATLFAFSPLIWEYSTGSEVFSFNNAFVAVLIFLTAKVGAAQRRPRSSSDVVPGLGWACAGAMVSGFALANQHSSLLSILPLATTVLVWIEEPLAKHTVKVLGLLVLSGLVGLSPYAHLVLAAQRGPTPGSWGDQTTLAGFLKHVLRSEYGTFTMLSFGSADSKGGEDGSGTESAVERTVIYLEDCVKQTHGIAFVLALASMWAVVAAAFFSPSRQTVRDQLASTKAPKKAAMPKGMEQSGGKKSVAGGVTLHRDFFLVIIFSLVFYVAVWHGVFSNLPLKSSPMAAAVHSRFWMQPSLFVCCLAGDGLAAILRFIFSHFLTLISKSSDEEKLGSSKVARRSPSLLCLKTRNVIAFGCALTITCTQVGWGWAGANQRQDDHGWTMHR